MVAMFAAWRALPVILSSAEAGLHVDSFNQFLLNNPKYNVYLADQQLARFAHV